jgi:hypothetical protein
LNDHEISNNEVDSISPHFLFTLRVSSFSNGSSHFLIGGMFMQMDNWTFGITMIIVGMGGTLLTLWILSLIMGLLKKAFPFTKGE